MKAACGHSSIEYFWLSVINFKIRKMKLKLIQTKTWTWVEIQARKKIYNYFSFFCQV